MSKTARKQYICRQCGSVHSRWIGKCPDCGAWDALEAVDAAEAESAIERSGSHGIALATWAQVGADEGEGAESRAVPLIELKATTRQRWSTGVGEFDRVLGGGFVPGSLVLVGGDPGIGKSTLLLQAAAGLVERERRVLYVSSEESLEQVRLRSMRLFEGEEGGAGKGERESSAAALEQLMILAEANLTRIVEQARKVRPDVLVLDSIQMLYLPSLAASPGSVTQLRRCVTELVYLAKSTGMAIVLVGHVTKEGRLAGPRLVEHLVDAVLSFEGDEHHAMRVLRGIKNRYGSTMEIGLFEMCGTGLEPIEDTSRLIDESEAPRPGNVICPVMHGSRCLLVEVQALTAPGFLGSAKRRTSGLDGNRLAMIVAVLEQHGGQRLADRDIFVSVMGGLKVLDPAADAAVAAAIASAHLRRPMPAATAVAGELGLDGRLRGPTQLEHRVREATRLGFRRLLSQGGGSAAGRRGGGRRELAGLAAVSDVGALLKVLEDGGVAD